MTTPSIPNAGDVVNVNFQFLDESGSKNRPVIVISNRSYNQNWGVFILAPITGSAGSVGGAIEIQDLAAAGLNRRSFCRGILMTYENTKIQRNLGTLSAGDRDKVRKLIRETLSI
jgi:mRNA-degrading endonuclease toxin of MazEF toxin-antitoxin module